MDKKKFATVSDYINSFPAGTKKLLQQMRKTIQAATPAAVESISYGMPAYKYKGKPLAYFAGYANHIGFYATPNNYTAFAKELAGYKQGKGSVQFPSDEPLPLTLITKMVQYRQQLIEVG